MSILATKQQKRSKRTRQRLVDSAITLFHEYDVETVTIDDICRACGVTKGSFYHNFASKDHIVTLTVVKALDSYIKENFMFDENEELNTQMSKLLLCCFDFYRSLGKKMTRHSYESLMRSCVELHFPGREFTDNMRKIVNRIVKEKGIPQGLDEKNLYWLIIASTSGSIMKWSSQQDTEDNPIDWEAIIRTQINLILK